MITASQLHEYLVTIQEANPNYPLPHDEPEGVSDAQRELNIRAGRPPEYKPLRGQNRPIVIQLGSSQPQIQNPYVGPPSVQKYRSTPGVPSLQQMKRQLRQSTGYFPHQDYPMDLYGNPILPSYSASGAFNPHEQISMMDILNSPQNTPHMSMYPPQGKMTYTTRGYSTQKDNPWYAHQFPTPSPVKPKKSLFSYFGTSPTASPLKSPSLNAPRISGSDIEPPSLVHPHQVYQSSADALKNAFQKMNIHIPDVDLEALLQSDLANKIFIDPHEIARIAKDYLSKAEPTISHVGSEIETHVSRMSHRGTNLLSYLLQWIYQHSAELIQRKVGIPFVSFFTGNRAHSLLAEVKKQLPLTNIHIPLDPGWDDAEIKKRLNAEYMRRKAIIDGVEKQLREIDANISHWEQDVQQKKARAASEILTTANRRYKVDTSTIEQRIKDQRAQILRDTAMQRKRYLELNASERQKKLDAARLEKEHEQTRAKETTKGADVFIKKMKPYFYARDLAALAHQIHQETQGAVDVRHITK